MKFILERRSETEFTINQTSGVSSLGGIADDVLDSIDTMISAHAAEQIVFYITEDVWPGADRYKVIAYDDDGNLVLEEIVNIG